MSSTGLAGRRIYSRPIVQLQKRTAEVESGTRVMTSVDDAAPPPGPAARAIEHTHSLSRLVRPRHWVKNAFVLAPAVFAGVFVNPADALRALAAAGMFCLAASAVYVFNDLLDAPTDRLHPVKRH